MMVLQGNLAPNGAIIKPSAASPRLMKHRGRAVVFENADDFRARIDDPDLDVDADSVLVLKNAGPGRLSGHARGRHHGAAQEAARRRASPTWCASRTPG